MTNKQAIRKAAWDLVERELREAGVSRIDIAYDSPCCKKYTCITSLKGEKASSSESLLDSFNFYTLVGRR